MRRRQRPRTTWPLEEVKLKDKVDNKDVKDEETTTTSDSSWPLEDSQAQGQGRQESYISNIRKYRTEVKKEIDIKDFRFRISFPLG